MTLRQSRIHHLDRLDLELHDVATRGGQLEHLTTQGTLHRPPINPHHLSGRLVEVRAKRATRPDLNPRWSSSDERQRGASVETIIAGSPGQSHDRRRRNNRRGEDSDHKPPHAQPPSAQRPKSVPESSSSMVSSSGTLMGAPSVVRG